MTPQIINAGKIRLHHPTSKSADEHFENLRRQFADALQRLRALVDEAINAGDFVKASDISSSPFQAKNFDLFWRKILFVFSNFVRNDVAICEKNSGAQMMTSS
uniref:Vinculin n=1 Tax=Romanomermis culicivorax TaxID=13658 RepID=A0A915HIY4_ROMCU